jgi:hypothetical protein
VLEETTNELFGRDGATLKLVGGRLFVREGDEPIFQFAQAVVAEGDAKDVRGEILEGLLAGAYRFGVDHPVFAPDAGRDCREQRSLFQLVTKLGAKDPGERFNGNEEVFA